MNRKILIVEDQALSRDLLRNMLKEEYTVLEATNGIEAVKILKTEYDTLSAVILDLIMPQMDGFEVLDIMKQDSDLAQIPVIVATAEEGNASEKRALKAGAKDYVTKPYDPDILKNRLWNTINLKEQAAIVNATRRDALTGLYSRAAFFDMTRKMVQENDPGFYIMACFDIDKFKVINDQYGSHAGDRMLKAVADIFREGFTAAEGIVGRIMADNFAVLYPRSFMDSDKIAEIRDKVSLPVANLPSITFSIGRYIVDDILLEPSAMYDRALIAKECIKGRYDQKITVYDETMRNRILTEQEIISEMKPALSAGQFVVWYQPQYNHFTGSLIGAEALIRWQHPVKGIIQPEVFVPIFEKNGFIYEMDQFVWEQVCILQKQRQLEGKPLISVSVNVSRYDIFREDMVAVITGLIKKYEIPAESIRLEITETAFVKSGDQVIRVIGELKEFGFTVEIDDFGSGYSSLNTLKDVPADVLKLDMRFIGDGKNSDKGGNIVESVIRMARWIGMSVIAEGVERPEQADFLKSIGCNYIQGFLYSRPLPREEYLELIDNKPQMEEMKTFEAVETYDNDAFWNPESIETIIFNSFVGGACVFEYRNGDVEVIRANEKYIKILCGDRKLAKNAINLRWVKYITPETRESALQSMQRAIATGEEVTDEMVLAGFRMPGRNTYLQASMRVIARAGDRYLFYCVIEDLTEKKESLEREKENDTLMHLILDNVASGVTAVELDGDNVEYLFTNEKYCSMLGYTREQYAEEVKDTYGLFHPDDRDRIYRAVHNLSPGDKALSLEYRMTCRDGNMKWVRMIVVSTRFAQENKVLQLSVFEDITEERRQQDHQKDLIEHLPCGAGIFEYKNGVLDVIYLNSKYWRLVGRDPDDDNALPILEYIQLEDRAYLAMGIQKMILSGQDQEFEIHILHGSGHYNPYLVRGNVRRLKTGKMILYVTYTPIAENAVAFRQMLPVALETMMAASTDLSFVKDRALHYVCASRAFAKMVGYEDEKEIIGKTDYELFEKEIADKFRNDDNRILNSGESLVDYVERLPIKDGQVRYSSTSKFLLKDSSQSIIGLYGVGRDITEDKEAFGRLRTLTDTIPGGLATYEITPEEIRTLYISDGVFNLIDCTKEEFDLVNTNPLSFIVEEDKPEIQRQIDRIILDGTPVNCYYRVPHKDGKEYWINLRGTETERQGDSIIVNTVMFDVTEQIVAREKVNAMEQENRNRYEHELQLRRGLIQDSIFNYQLNMATGIIEEYESANNEIASMYKGARVNDAMMQFIVDRIVPQDKERIRKTMFIDGLREAYKNGERFITTTYRRLLSDNTYHWVRLEAFMMEKPDTGEAVAFLNCRDIDREWKNQLSIETILDEDIESVFHINVKNGIASIAHMLESSNYIQVYSDFDFNKESQRGCEKVVLKEDKEVFLNFYNVENLTEYLKHEDILTTTYRVRESNGIHRKLAKAYYLDEMKDFIVLIRRDITRLDREEQRQKQELQAAVDEANKASQAKSEFLSNMSHDIRTPLNAVLAFSNEEFLDKADEKLLREYLGKINLSGKYLLGIINDVLDMSRIEQNRIILKPEPYPLHDFEKTIKNIIEELGKKKNVEFIMDTGRSGKTEMVVDHVRFNQIFVNLLSNAVKFTPPGGKVEFIVEEYPGQEYTYIKRFTVRDNGIGMSKEFIPHAFESFSQEYRRDSAVKAQGTGLGLSIVKELVQMMDGTISLESEINQGTVFTITFPVVENNREYKVTAKEQKEELTNYAGLKGARILLAEDNEINAEIAIALFDRYGSIVEHAENGQEACEKFQASKVGYYDFILMDIRMPIMDGLEATHRIRRMKRKDAATVPIVAMTADAFVEAENMAIEKGMNAYVAKPIDAHKLYDICCSFLK